MNSNDYLKKNDATRVIDLYRKDMKEIFSEVIREEFKNIKNLFDPPHSGNSDYLTRRQTADRLHITLPTLRSWTTTGKIKSHQVGRRVLYKPDDINRALKEQPRFLRK